MKRFLVLAVAVVMLAASAAWAQEWVTCEGANAGYCMWGSCSSIASGPPPDGKATCAEAYKNCLDNSSSHTVYSDATCSTVKEAGNRKSCGEYCQWGSDCWEIQTDPDGVDGTATTTCTEALANCDNNGDGHYTGTTTVGKGVTCDGTLVAPPVEKCGFYCDWGPVVGNEGGCHEIKPDATYTTCEAAIAHCDKDGARYSSSTCTGTQVGGETSCGGSCLWATSGCVELKTNANNEPEPITTCDAARANCQAYGQLFSDDACQNAVSVRLIANKAATPGLRVSYAKNRVTVNWTPAAKVSSGTVQLINMKGAAVSTAFIKGSSSKVTAKLGTVGVPAGMYFVHINAVGQNGKKIVSQSAISIVK